MDELVKVTVVSHALRLATGTADCDHDDAYHQVPCGDGGPFSRAHKLFREVKGNKMTGQRFRTLLTKSKIVHGPLASHDADVLYLKWQKAVNQEGALESVAFCEQLEALAEERFAGEDANQALTKLLDLALAAGYDC